MRENYIAENCEKKEIWMDKVRKGFEWKLSWQEKQEFLKNRAVFL